MLDRLRLRTEELLQASARARLELAAVEQGVARLGALYRRYADLFRLDRLSEVQMALAGATGAEEKRIRFLLEFLAHGRSRYEAANELDEFLTWEAHSFLSTGAGPGVPMRMVRWATGEIEDPAERRELYSAWLDALAEQAPVLESLHERQRGAVEELGYGSYLVTCEILSGIDLRGVGREAERFLAETAELHRELLAWYLPRLAGVQSALPSEADALRLERAAPYDRFFPGRNLPVSLSGLVAGSGLDPRVGGRLRIEVERARAQGPGSAVHVLRVPDEVLVRVAEHAGRPVHASLLRSLGIALHRAHTPADHPLEFRWLGDASVSLGFGALFEGLLEERPLMQRLHGVPRAELGDYLRLSAMLRLLRVRRQSAQLRFELELEDFAEAGQAGDRYAQLHREATGLGHDPRGALRSVEPGFRVARRLRAEQLGAILALHLRDRFDEDWYRNPRSGPVLRDLLGQGRAFTAAELAVQTSSAGLSFDALRTRLEELV